MKKIIATLFTLNILLAQSFGQETPTPLSPIWTVNFVPFGSAIIGEFPISKKSTIRAEIGGVMTVAGGEISYSNIDVGVGFSLFGSINYRYYHLVKKRTDPAKYLYNSGNFIFGQVLYYAPPLWKNDKFNFESRTSIGAGYGLQRVLKNRFVFSIGLGLGYYLPQKDVFFVGDLTLGILLKPSKKLGK
ncbi:MAG: hypothetical protein ACI9XO_002024 [Paraglaciecola sp.]|jgi:hypothetical protein